MQAHCRPLKALRPPRDWVVTGEGQVELTLADLALWVSDRIEEEPQISSPIRLARPDFHSSRRLRSAFAAPCPRAPCASAPLVAALRHAAAEQLCPENPLALRRRIFNGRSFLLWVEDSSEQLSATIFACDEVSGYSGCLRLEDADLRVAFAHYMSGRQGIASALGFCHRAEWPLEPEPQVGGFLQDLLDTVYFEAGSFGHDWEIRLPGLGPRTRKEELGEGFGPEIGIAAAPGRAPRVEAAISAGTWPLPPSHRPAVMKGRRPPIVYEDCDMSRFSLDPGHRPLASRLGSLLASGPYGACGSTRNDGPWEESRPLPREMQTPVLRSAASGRPQCEDRTEPAPMRARPRSAPRTPPWRPPGHDRHFAVTTPRPAPINSPATSISSDASPLRPANLNSGHSYGGPLAGGAALCARVLRMEVCAGEPFTDSGAASPTASACVGLGGDSGSFNGTVRPSVRETSGERKPLMNRDIFSEMPSLLGRSH